MCLSYSEAKQQNQGGKVGGGPGGKAEATNG